jgi:hypothetical protein
MKRPFRIVLFALAAIGAAYIAFGIYATMFLADCMYVESAQAVSPSGQHFATFQQTICSVPDKSRSQVTMGAKGQTVKTVIMEVGGTSDVELTWNGDTELIVSLPASALVRRFNTSGEWPRVSERRIAAP